MFYHACIAGGCSLLQAKLLYAGVRIGAWTSSSLAPNALSRHRLLLRVPFKAVADEQFVQDKFQELAIDVKLLRDDATIAELDAVIAKHLQF